MKYKVNIHPHEGIRHEEGLEVEDFYFGGRNIYLPFKNKKKGVKVFLGDGDDPHRVIDQAFPAANNSYHYDNPNKDINPLSYNEFSLLKNLSELFDYYNLGPNVYGETKIRINSNNYWALIIEDLRSYPQVDKNEALEAEKELNEFLTKNNIFKKPWEDEEPSNYFKTNNRGYLAVDLDWGLFQRDMVSKRKLREFKGRKYLTLQNDEVQSDICLGTVGFGIERRDWVKNIVKPNFEDYCEKQDYDFYLVSDGISIDFENNAYEETRCDTLFKIRLIEELFKKGYEYVAIMDCFDALITNMDIRLEKFINENNSIFFSADVNGWRNKNYKRTTNINTGFAIYKNDDFTKTFLEHAKNIEINWNERTRREINDQVLFQKVLRATDEYWENITINEPLQQSFWFYNKPNFAKNHEHLYNQHESPFIWEEGDFMIHFAGQPSADFLLEEFNKYLFGD